MLAKASNINLSLCTTGLGTSLAEVRIRTLPEPFFGLLSLILLAKFWVQYKETH